MSGPISLLGGMEHRPGCETIDDRLLEIVGIDEPVVTVVPVASAPRKRAFTIDLARRYWSGRGAEVRIALPGEGRPDAVRGAIEAGDVIVLPGGDPQRLVCTLRDAELVEPILDRWRQGVALSGSSAGAMALAEWRPRLRPPSLLKLIPGFGVIAGCGVAPHYENATVRRWARRVSGRHPDLRVLGLGSYSGIVGAGERFQAVGPEAFVLLRDGHESRFEDGDQVSLDVAVA